MIEKIVNFKCGKDLLIGIISVGEKKSNTGILIIVGGPQYRVGSHRQFVSGARAFAVNGISTMRFDYRGMGDSEGDITSFESIGPDIKAAIDCFVETVNEVKKIVLWGLCDAASTIAQYAHQDNRVKGIILLNPWIRTDESLAHTFVKHYYIKRLYDRKFWNKLFSGNINLRETVCSLKENIAKAIGLKLRRGKVGVMKKHEVHEDNENRLPLPERMLIGLKSYEGKIFVILSGNDLTANEFKDMIEISRSWRQLKQKDNVIWFEMKEANHTFSSEKWKKQVERKTIEWAGIC